MYSLISIINKEVNKAKGVKKKLRQKEYFDVLYNTKFIKHDMKKKTKTNYMRLVLMIFIRSH